MMGTRKQRKVVLFFFLFNGLVYDATEEPAFISFSLSHVRSLCRRVGKNAGKNEEEVEEEVGESIEKQWRKQCR